MNKMNDAWLDNIIDFFDTILPNWFSNWFNQKIDKLYGLPPITPYTTYDAEDKVYTQSQSVKKVRTTRKTYIHNYRPPRAEFFSCEGGREETILGNYEEKYLPSWDFNVWKYMTERKEAKAQGILSERKEK